MVCWPWSSWCCKLRNTFRSLCGTVVKWSDALHSVYFMQVLPKASVAVGLYATTCNRSWSLAMQELVGPVPHYTWHVALLYVSQILPTLGHLCLQPATATRWDPQNLIPLLNLYNCGIWKKSWSSSSLISWSCIHVVFRSMREIRHLHCI